MSCRGCPPIDGNCDHNSVLCSGPDNEICPFTEVCVYPPQFNETCDVDLCPAWCKDGEITCHDYGFDWFWDLNITFHEECPKFKEYCLPEFNENGCPNMCPVHCPEGYKECPGGQDFNGCDIVSGNTKLFSIRYFEVSIKYTFYRWLHPY